MWNYSSFILLATICSAQSPVLQSLLLLPKRIFRKRAGSCLAARIPSTEDVLYCCRGLELCSSTKCPHSGCVLIQIHFWSARALRLCAHSRHTPGIKGFPGGFPNQPISNLMRLEITNITLSGFRTLQCANVRSMGSSFRLTPLFSP